MRHSRSSLLAVVAMTGIITSFGMTPCVADAGGPSRLAMPIAQEETIYRPDCQAEERREGWQPCAGDVGGRT